MKPPFHVGANIAEGTIVCVDNALKLYLETFTKSQWENNNLDYQIFIGHGFVNCKLFNDQIFMQIEDVPRVFYMLKGFKTCSWTFIPIPNVDQSFQKLEKILMFMIKRKS